MKTSHISLLLILIFSTSLCQAEQQTPPDKSPFIDKQSYMDADGQLEKQPVPNTTSAAIRAFGKSLLKDDKSSVSVHETKHFIIYHDLKDNTTTKQQLAIPEQLRQFMKRMFAVTQKHMLMEEKLIVLLWRKRSRFKKAAARLENIPAKQAQLGNAYYSTRLTYPYINLSLQVAANEVTDARTHFIKVFAHEYTHAFLSRFRARGQLRAWIDEGLAESIPFIILDKTMPSLARIDGMRSFYLSNLIKRLRLNNLPSITSFMDEASFPPSHADAYAHAWAFVRYMIKFSPQKLFKFIVLLKTSTPSPQKHQALEDSDALKESSLTFQKAQFKLAFGESIESHETKWRNWLTKKAAGAKAILFEAPERDALSMAEEKYKTWLSTQSENAEALPFFLPIPPPKTIQAGQLVHVTPPYKPHVLRLKKAQFKLQTSIKGIRIHPESGAISWTPTKAQIGWHQIKIILAIQKGLSITAFKWEVEVINKKRVVKK